MSNLLFCNPSLVSFICYRYFGILPVGKINAYTLQAGDTETQSNPVKRCCRRKKRGCSETWTLILSSLKHFLKKLKYANFTRLYIFPVFFSFFMLSMCWYLLKELGTLSKISPWHLTIKIKEFFHQCLSSYFNSGIVF